MFTKTMKWMATAALFCAVLWNPSENYRLLLQFVVCAGACLVAWKAFRSEQSIWALGFVAIAICFNPIQPAVFSRGVFLGMYLLSLAAFLSSSVMLRTQPNQMIPSLTR
jgi:hypothetical protein